MARRASYRLSTPLAYVLPLVGAAVAYLVIEPPRLEVAEASPEPLPAAPPAPSVNDTVELSGFLRGNVHVHTWMSDGDSDPKTVVEWYADHGYDFVAITDHNRRVDALPYAKERAGFVVVSGEEVTMAASGKPVHVNALCTDQTIGEAKFKSRPQALTWAVTQIHARDGVALVNHPNFGYALETAHIAAASQPHLLDIYNGHPQVHNDGNAEHSSVESKWQELLDRGIMVAPAAVDDAHTFAKAPREGIPNSRPGTGWIGVAAEERSAAGVCAALRKGHLYASNGPEVSRIRFSAGTLEVWLPSAHGTVEFVARGGTVVSQTSPHAETGGWVARFAASQRDEVIRARVITDRGRAWTPAFRVAR